MAQEKSKTVIAAGERVTKFDDLVTVVGTEKSKFIETGKKTKIHRILAEKLEKKGSVTIVKE